MGWRIGQLAAKTGLTVRALHHYDHVGLVRPSGRTPSGHRLYAEEDVERLYRVVALKQLGLPLDSIAGVLDGALPAEQVLIAHRDFLERQLLAIRTLRAQIATILELGHGPANRGTTDFLALIKNVTTVDDTIKQYFNEAQLAALAERREQVGEQAINDVTAQWPILMARVQHALDTGTDPSSPKAQELAREWMELLHAFHGGDDGLRDSLYRMHADNAAQIQREHGGPSPAQLEFIRQANAASA